MHSLLVEWLINVNICCHRDDMKKQELEKLAHKLGKEPEILAQAKKMVQKANISKARISQCF